MTNIITTVGTSIFTNYQKPEVQVCLERKYQPITNAFIQTSLSGNGEEIPASGIYAPEYRASINSLTEVITDCWFKYPGDEFNKSASAEISSILKIAEQEKKCVVHLVATDTLQSVLAAELIVAWFEAFKAPNISKVLFQRQNTVFESQSNENYVVKDLRLRSQQAYRNGFMNLIELLVRISPRNKTKLNITGGFKGIIPIVTLFSQLFEIPIYYLFEEDGLGQENNLIKLGNLPIRFDLGYIENCVKFLADPGKLSEQKNKSWITKMFELGLIVGDQPPFELSIVGRLIKGKLESDEIPFQKTIFGYLLEYKLYEYYNQHENYKTKYNIELGRKISDKEGEELEDADLWLEDKNDGSVVIAEIKPAGIDWEALQKKVRKILEKCIESQIELKQLWVVLYKFDSNDTDSIHKKDIIPKTDRVFTPDFIENYPNLKFCIKLIKITPNTIDGDKNRIKYQEFMRQRNIDISNVKEYSVTK